MCEFLVLDAPTGMDVAVLTPESVLSLFRAGRLMPGLSVGQPVGASFPGVDDLPSTAVGLLNVKTGQLILRQGAEMVVAGNLLDDQAFGGRIRLDASEPQCVRVQVGTSRAAAVKVLDKALPFMSLHKVVEVVMEARTAMMTIDQMVSILVTALCHSVGRQQNRFPAEQLSGFAVNDMFVQFRAA